MSLPPFRTNWIIYLSQHNRVHRSRQQWSNILSCEYHPFVRLLKWKYGGLAARKIMNQSLSMIIRQAVSYDCFSSNRIRKKITEFVVSQNKWVLKNLIFFPLTAAVIGNNWIEFVLLSLIWELKFITQRDARERKKCLMWDVTIHLQSMPMRSV